MNESVLLAVPAAAVATLLFLALSRAGGARVSRHRRPAGAWFRALAPLAPLTVVATALLVWRLDPEAVLLGWAVLAAGCLVWLPFTGRWSAVAHASWSLTTVAGLAYLVAMAAWTVQSGLHGAVVGGAWALWCLELVAYALLLSYGWEIHDSLGSQTWRRRLSPLDAALAEGEEVPFVSIHVPSHNEPPDLLIDTLEALLRLDYPAYEVLVIDNNTEDDALCAPVEAFCAAHPEVLRFHRLRDWPGFKSGALNYAEQHTDPRATLIGVVDADYQVRPEWLRSTVGAFRDTRTGFVQTPQDYRDWGSANYLRGLYFSYDYFFVVSQPSRDERNAAIFGGTMGLVRREALRDVGGWDEWCVTEDAELSLRLLQRGWTGHHLDTALGYGIMPLTFEALKRQRFRWCFGGMQILKRHWRQILPWSRGTHLTLAQRLAYLVGGVQWFGDLVGLLFSLIVIASLLDLALGGGFVVRRLGGLLLVAVPFMVAMGLLRAVAVLRAVGDGARWRDAVGAFLVWLSLGWVVAMASVRGLVEPKGVFLRTPKVRGEGRWTNALRSNLVELALAAAAVGSAGLALALRPDPTVLGLVALLAVPVLGWLAAPAHSIAAMRADLPPQLRRRRAGEWTRGWWTPRTRLSLASMAGAAAVAALVFGIVQPMSVQAPRVEVLPVEPKQVPSRAPSVAVPAVTTTAGSTTPDSPTDTPTGTPTGTPAERPSPATTTQLPTVTSTASLPTQATATAAPPTSRPGTGSPTARPTPSRRPTSPGSPTTTQRP